MADVDMSSGQASHRRRVGSFQSRQRLLLEERTRTATHLTQRLQKHTFSTNVDSLIVSVPTLGIFEVGNRASCIDSQRFVQPCWAAAVVSVMVVYEDWPPPEDRSDRRQVIVVITIALGLVAWLTWLFVAVIR